MPESTRNFAHETKAFRCQIHTSSDDSSAFANLSLAHVMIICYVDNCIPKTLEYACIWRFLSFYHQNLQIGQGDTNEPVLKNVFKKYGEVVEVRVICDRISGKSKGYGFVVFNSEEAASIALAAVNNQLLQGRNIRVEYAQPKERLHHYQK